MVFKVSSSSNPGSVAGAIANSIKDDEKVELQVVGAGALNQAIKSIIIAKGYLTQVGKDIYINPSFQTVHIENIERTAIKLVLEVK